MGTPTRQELAKRSRKRLDRFVQLLSAFVADKQADAEAEAFGVATEETVTRAVLWRRDPDAASQEPSELGEHLARQVPVLSRRAARKQVFEFACWRGMGADHLWDYEGTVHRGRAPS